jgi:hypothetical protein
MLASIASQKRTSFIIPPAAEHNSHVNLGKCLVLDVYEPPVIYEEPANENDGLEGKARIGDESASLTYSSHAVAEMKKKRHRSMVIVGKDGAVGM